MKTEKTMKKLLLLAVVLAVIVTSSSAGTGLIYNADVSVTQTNTQVAFADTGSGGIGVGFKAMSILVRSLSSSANTCYLDLRDRVASTSDIALEPGGSIGFSFPPTSQPADGWDGMGMICSSGQTATFRVTAMR
jgi:hypothetical protein